MKRIGLMAAAFALYAACALQASAQTASNVPYGATSAAGPLTLDVYEPGAGDGSPRPLVIYVHGGGFSSGDKEMGARYSRGFTDAGFVYASIDYRLSGEAPFPAAPVDVLTAVRYFRANAGRWNVDPDRIGLFGTSAGGALVLFAGIAGNTGRYEGEAWPGVSSGVGAVVSHFGPADFVNVPVGAAENRYLGASPAERPDLAFEASPVNWVDADDPPTLLAHGEQDPVVPIAHSELMFAALQRGSVEASFVRVANAGHGFVPTPAGAQVAPSPAEIQATTVAFFAAHLTSRTDSEPPTVASVALDGGRKKVKRGQTAAITWQSSDDREVASHSILLSLDGGQTFPVTIAEGLPGTTSSYEWEVSPSLSKSKTAFVLVRARDAAGNTGQSTSAQFKIR